MIYTPALQLQQDPLQILIQSMLLVDIGQDAVSLIKCVENITKLFKIQF